MPTRAHVAWHSHLHHRLSHLSHLLLLAVAVVFVPSAQCDVLKFVQIVHRHGDRGPVLIAPGFAQDWEDLGVIEGQLTKIGVAQQKAFGTFLRSTYGDHLGLSDTYKPSEIHVRATESDRTIGSAYALLSGLYPDHEVPIPVYTVPEPEDYESRFWSNCPSWFAWMQGIEDIMSPIVLNELDLTLLNTRFQFHAESMSKTGLLGMIYDNLECMDAHFLDTKFMSAGKRFNITNMAKRIWYAQYVGAFKENARGPAAQELIRAFAKNARAAVDGTETQKMKFYSAHDTTLVGMHDALGLFAADGNKSDLLLPGYSNSIIFELWEESDKYSIRIKRGHPEERATGVTDEWMYSAQTLGVISDVEGNYSYSPYLAPWLEYVDSLPSFEEGCCLQEEDFERRKCATSMDNTDHSHDPVCRLYQEHCPLTACGTESVFSQPLDKCMLTTVVPTSAPPTTQTTAMTTTPTEPPVETPVSPIENDDAAVVSLQNTVKALGVALAISVACFLCLGIYSCRRLRKYRVYGGLEGLEDSDASPDNEAEDIGIIDPSRRAQFHGSARMADLEKVALTSVA